ncbi:MAG: tetratricopeptide repeat protein [Novosphingobium sp.]
MRRIVLALLLAAAAAPSLAMPDAAGQNLAAARAALARGDGIAAEAELQRALAAGATRPELAADMGEAMLQQGERGKARDWLEPGQFTRDQEARGWRLLGLLERQDGNLAAAGRAYDRALAVNPKDPLLWVDIGRLRYQGGEQLQAFDAAQRALAAGPDNPRALEFQAQLVRDSAGDAAALPLFEKALAAASDDLALLGGYAASLGEVGRTQEMLAVTRRMLSLDPRSSQAFYLQAVVAARVGDIDLARAMLNRTDDTVEDTPAALLLGGLLELEAGNANTAAQALGQLADQQDANPRVQLLLARALYEAGDYQGLFARFDALAARGDASPYLLAVMGRAKEDQGDRAGAALLLDRAAAARPPELLPIFERDSAGVLEPRWNAAQGSAGTTGPYVRSLLAAGDQAGAAQVAGRFLELHPGSSEALGLQGDVDLLAGRPEDSLRHYQQSAQVRFPDQLLLRSAIALERAERGGQVQALVAAYAGINPSSRLAARMSANLALAGGDWPRARLLLENLRLRGGNRDAGLLADLSLAQLRSGDGEAALETATRAWALAPASFFAVQARALALASLGRDKDTARQLIAQARKTGPDTPLLAEARRKLR